MISKQGFVWALAILIAMGSFDALADASSVSNKVFDQLLRFNPGWVTRSVTSHDTWGGNGDGSFNGQPKEKLGGVEYNVLFHGKGEGRITRLWMTANLEKQVPVDFQELWIIVDGHTAYRGSVVDFFDGKGPWKSPLVLGYQASSGGFLSYVPFGYSREAKILLKGKPYYFQVTYREGAGSSAGPTADELTSFLTEKWWERLETDKTGATSAGFNLLEAERRLHITGADTKRFWRLFQNSALRNPLVPGPGAELARGPTVVTSLVLKTNYENLAKLRVRVSGNEPVPAEFFFNAPTKAPVQSAVTFADPEAAVVATRLPIPLQEGETLSIEADEAISFRYGVELSSRHSKGVHLLTQYRDQWAPGKETTMPFFETQLPAQFVSLVEKISDEGVGTPRNYLEGDEMIRTDGMSYPLQLGTGTEDYFNGGWYFLGEHSNPLSGQPGFTVTDPSDGWKHTEYVHGLYRHHVADPIVGRLGLSFRMEAGDVGAYTPARYRTLGLAYRFDGVAAVQHTRVDLAHITTNDKDDESRVKSAWDAERAEPSHERRFRYHKSVSHFRSYCPGAEVGQVDGFFLTRTYDAKEPHQRAEIRLNGRKAGVLFEAYGNSGRRFAQDAIWVPLAAGDCAKGLIDLEVDARGSTGRWSESEYEVLFYRLGDQAPKPVQGPLTRIFDVESYEGRRHYVNDHTIVRDDAGAWHLFGIFKQEPMGQGEEVDFIHGVTNAGSSPREWKEQSFQLASKPIALTAIGRIGETHLWAPHIVRDGSRWVMYYQGGGSDNDRASIRMATSTDLSNWTRAAELPVFEDVCVARDPMLFKQGDLWILYYTRCDSTESQKSGVAYRTSLDLVHWSKPSMALVLPNTPKMFNSGYTESPFVFERDGWYYLSVTSYPVEWNASFLFRSRTPFRFDGTPIARLETHAPEWVRDGDELFITHCGAGQGGVWMTQVHGL